MNGYKLVREQIFELISWKDTIDLSKRPIEDFDAIKVNFISYTTDTTGLKFLSISIVNLPDANKTHYLSLDGTEIRESVYSTYLDTRTSVLIFQENPKPPIDIPFQKRYAKLDYEIYLRKELRKVLKMCHSSGKFSREKSCRTGPDMTPDPPPPTSPWWFPVVIPHKFPHRVGFSTYSLGRPKTGGGSKNR